MSHLITIVDCSPATRVSPKIFVRWLDSVVTFCNSHLMIDEKNELTVIASTSTLNKVILSTQAGIKPARNIVSQEGQFEKFAFVTEIIRIGLVGMIDRSMHETANTSQDCLLASAIGIALCKVNTMKRLPSRILVVSCSMMVTSYAWQYMDLMNSFFAAQKLNVPIDGCVYMREEPKQRGSILEQGCDLTSGHFLNVPDVSGNLEYLLWIFLPDTATRETLLLPERRRATHRAACFCHRKIIDIGYVCSVCLSIFCSYSPICSSCQTHFKLNIPNKVMNQLSGSSKSSQSNDVSCSSSNGQAGKQTSSAERSKSSNNNSST